jgi:hypothetical protein
MATGGGWISLPLAIGVDRSHPQWPGSFFLSFFVVCLRDKNGHWGWPDLSPLAVGVDRGHPRWPNLSFFFFFFGSPKKSLEVGGGWWRLGN